MTPMYISLFTVAIPLIYTSEFRGVFETTKYACFMYVTYARRSLYILYMCTVITLCVAMRSVCPCVENKGI
jgi:hypothetical protein